YKSVDEELNNHIWVDEEIDEKANIADRPTYNYDNSGRTLKQKKADLKKAAQNIKSITSYLSLTNSLRFNVALTSTYKFLAVDAAVQLMKKDFVNEAVDTIVIDEDGDIIMVDNAVDSIVKSVEINVNDDKACMKRAIEKLDNMLEKDSKQINKGTKVRLQAALQYLCLRYQEVFLPMMAELEPLLIEYNENDLILVKKNLPLNQKPHCEQKLCSKG
ncbi:9316_t:CDS:2, partial [Racocetra fulgida]